ncbi:hypothetical protein MM326_15105 [Alkalihalobacillus sp. LMS6]|uniref:hypothetical protein n=1 Tax=Alkalihalobacillus sp. LMS6 TaxID=2924034 RepID=UPI0020D19B8C|nr:hypothetical protein [Alkalihalobacillus sp. LMS6]UTR05424.1 hypothetical protein MM326_15105 [Alkalihalobacillus sp. LMS6]
MNVDKARELMKDGIEEQRLLVLENINRAIETSARQHQTGGIVTLTSSDFSLMQIRKAGYFYNCPADKESVKFYIDNLTLAGFKVEQLFSSENEARLHISWADE